MCIYITLDRILAYFHLLLRHKTHLLLPIVINYVGVKALSHLHAFSGIPPTLLPINMSHHHHVEVVL